MSNEALIESHIGTLQARLDTFQASTEGYLTDLKLASMSFLTLNDPAMSFVVPTPAALVTDTTLTGDTQTGVQYPTLLDASQLLVDGAYTSAFLDYLQTVAQGTPLAAWGVALNDYRVSYAGLALVQAQAYAGQRLPAVYQTGALAMLSERHSRHEADFLQKWSILLSEAALNLRLQMLEQGVAIENVRERGLLDIAGIQSAYNEAVLDQARADFSAVMETVRLRGEEISLQVRREFIAAAQDFEVAELEVKKQLLDMDIFLAEQSDWIRRQHTEYALTLGKCASLVDFTRTALTASNLSKGTLTVYENTSEA